MKRDELYRDTRLFLFFLGPEATSEIGKSSSVEVFADNLYKFTISITFKPKYVPFIIFIDGLVGLAAQQVQKRGLDFLIQLRPCFVKTKFSLHILDISLGTRKVAHEKLFGTCPSFITSIFLAELYLWVLVSIINKLFCRWMWTWDGILSKKKESKKWLKLEIFATYYKWVVHHVFTIT